MSQVNDYVNLAKTLGITPEELNQLDFYNEEKFNDSGVAVKNKFVFSKKSPEKILKKVKGLDQNNTIIIDCDILTKSG